jgi:hypothetical protein
MTITCEIEKKNNNKNTEKKNVFLFTPGVHVEKNKKTTTTTIRFLDVCFCVGGDMQNSARFFRKKYILISRIS